MKFTLGSEYESASEGMKALMEHEQKAQDTLRSIEHQLVELETQYFDDTQHGNVVRGWEGYIDIKPGKRDLTFKKNKPYTDAEHLFTHSSVAAWSTLLETSESNRRLKSTGKKALKKRKRQEYGIDDLE